ncbi:MAG TPA: choice-of-anchor D domain-containing protein [Gemmatimonadales bacterium]|nr:choice-of-anchor D domain-containing protein [Gemmatimonadales bacterium]
MRVIKSTMVLLTIASIRVAAAQVPTMVVSPPSVNYTVPTGSVWPSDVPVLITSDGATAINGLTRTIAYGGSQPTGWLKATLSASGTPAIMSFQVDATLLLPGTYDATVTVKSRLTGVAPQSIAVKVTVTDAPPAIAVADTAILTGTAGSLIPVDLKLDVTNGGGGKLSGLQSTVTYPSGEITGWLTAALGSPDAPTMLNLRATPSQSLPGGLHHASVVITAKGTSNSPQTVDVYFKVTGLNPRMQLTPSTVSFVGIIGTSNPAAQSVTITNLGGGTIEGLQRSTTYAPGEPTGWLKASLGGRTGSTLVLSAFIGTLTPGVYTATVQVTSTTAYNSPQNVTVRFAVGNSPAHLTMTPTAHDFGSVGVGGASAAQAFTITNDGGLPSGTLSGQQGGGLAPPAAGLGGNNPGDFRVDPTSSCAELPGLVLAPHTSCDIVLWFSPTGAGSRSAALALGATPGGNVVAALSGTGTTAQVITVTPPSYDFGTFGAGLPATTQRFVLTNPLPWPTGPLQQIPGGFGIPSPLMSGPNPGDFYFDPSSSCAQVLATGLPVGGSCYFDVTFLPTGLGARSALFAFQMTPGGVVQIAFSGTSLANGFLTITPTTKDFGSVGVGGASAAQVFTITNNGVIPSGPFTASSGSFGIVFGGPNPGDFIADPTTSTCVGAFGGLAPHASCDIVFRFSPTAVGARSAGLSMSASPGGTLAVALSGTGTTDQVISVTPLSHDFGDVGVGISSPTQRFVLTNPLPWATGPITAGGVTGPNPGDFHFDPNSTCVQALSVGLAVGGSCYFDVSFIPQGLGPRSATMGFLMTPGGVVQIPFSGNGVTPQVISISPASFDFGSVVVGQTGAPATFTLTNVGGAFEKVTGLALSGPAAGDYSVTDPTASCALLAPGATCALTVTFTPQGTGQRAAVLNVSTRTGASASADLTGTGTPAMAIAIAPSSTDFGSLLVGQASASVLFTITNTGIVRAVPSTISVTGPAAFDYGFAALDFFTDPSPCTLNFPIDPGSSCAVRVVFAPIGGGPRPAELTVTVKNPNQVGAVTGHASLTGTGTTALAMTPSPYDFGPVARGQTRSVVLTVTNQSGAPAAAAYRSLNSDYVDILRLPDFSSVRVWDFTLTESSCGGQTLAPSESCSATIAFSPQATGLRHASFSIGGVTAQITGTGDGGIQLSVSPNPDDFGTLNVGATRTALLTVTNNWVVATAPKVTEITLGGTNASEFARIPETGDCVQAGVAPGASCTLRVAFTPTSTGPKSASVTATFQSAVSGWLPGSTTATLTGTGSLEAMIFLSSSKNPSVAEEDVTFTARVTHPDGSSLSPMPVGLPITFVLSSQANNQVVALKSDGTASVKTSFKAAGVYPVSVSFADDILGTGSNSLTQLVTPLPGDPTVGRVAGTIHDRDGQPVAGVTVFLIGVTVPTPTTATDGSYEMNGIPPGKYTVLATKGQFCVDLDSEEFTVTAQQTTTVSLTMNCPPLLSGAVTVTGPAPGALTVQATPVRGGTSFSGPVQSDGTYSLFIGADEYNVAAVGPLRCRSSVEGIDAVHQQDLVTADLTVSCTNEIVRITPTSYDFGGVRWGQSSSPATFTVTNVTEQPLLFGQFAYGIGLYSPSVLNNCNLSNCDVNDRTNEFVITQTSCSSFGTDVSLAAGASCSVDVRFTPLIGGVQNGTVEVCTSCTIDALHRTVVQATLAGHGRDAEATLALSPGSFDFGAVQVNTSSKAKQFVAVNTGPDASGPISVSLAGADAADFALGGKCQGATLAGSSGESCEVDVTFTPHGFGPRTATVTITGTPGGTASATLTGMGDGLLTLAPTAQDFGSVAVGQSGTPVAFTVTNGGSTDVLINHFETSGPNFTDFVIDPGSCGPALVPTGSCTFSVTFTPKATGARAATLTVAGTGGAPTVSANLTGTGGAVGVLSFTPASFDFGNRQVNSTIGGGVFFSVKNTGSTATPILDHLEFTGAAAADFFADASYNQCNGVSLAPGASCTLLVGFIPHATGSRSATVTVSSSAGDASGSAQLTGTGVPPAILTVTPPSKDFGSVDLGQTSPVFTFTLTNTGPSPGGLVVTEAFSGPGRDDYYDPYNECNQIALNVGTSCQFRVNFSPKAGGPRPATFTMVFEGGTATVNLTGVGTSTNALLAVSPDSQDFGFVFLGASSEIKTMTVTNVGGSTSGPLVNFLFTGPGAYEFGFLDESNQCAFHTLAPGASCTIGLLFIPQVYGRRSATLTISDGGLGGTVKLTGGVTPGGVLTITPTSKNFGTIPVGSFSLPTEFTVTNTGTTITFLSGVFIDDPAGNDYALEPGSLCAGVPFLEVGASCNILVHFEPKRTGPLPATLFVYYDRGTVSASLTGTGGPPAPTPTVGSGGTIELTAFTATDAARDLLGVPTLTAAHRAYLDGLGNHDGTYDLGDLLAYLDRHHIKLSPALLAGPAQKERVP